jgi:6-phosphogluconolactonase
VSNERRVLVHPDKATLAGSVAARFITKIIDVLDELGDANICLTGGTMGAAVLAAINSSPARDSVDWSRVTFWWGDERYLPLGDPDRNDTQSRAALLDHLALDASQIKSFPAPGEQADIEQAAVAYERELAVAAERSGSSDGAAYPRFDITFLGVGPDGHIASLFPEHASLHVSDRVVIAETDSPKPPPERLTLTLPVINSSDRVWLVLSGSDKASALGLALAGASIDDVPAAGAQGRKRTVFFVDQDAAAEVPENLIAPANYWTSADDAE